MGFVEWFENRAEIKAAERKAFESAKVKAHAEKQREAIEDAEAAGEERAYSGRTLPKPNPKKIAAIKSGCFQIYNFYISYLSKMADKAATAGERMKEGEMFETAPSSQRKPASRMATARKTKAKSPEEEMNDYNKKMKDTLGY